MMDVDMQTRKICSGCAEDLTAGGFRIIYPRGAQLHMDTCFKCGKRLPVHEAWVAGRKPPRRTKRKTEG